jgi:hypothetical protein
VGAEAMVRLIGAGNETVRPVEAEEWALHRDYGCQGCGDRGRPV